MADTDGEQVDLLTALQRSITRARTVDLLVEAYRLSACPRCGGDRLRTKFTGNGGPCHAGGQGQSAVTAPPSPPECDCYPGGFTPDTYEGPQRHCRTHGDGSADAAPVVSPAEELRAAADAMSAEADRLDAMDRDATEAEEGSWSEDWCNYRHRDNSVASLKERALIAHRRNTLARDAATLRATAAWLLEEAQNLAYWGTLREDTREVTNATALAVARAFMGEETDRG